MSWIERRLGFRPARGATIATLAALAILLALGTWQMERRAWKTALIAERTTNVAATPVNLPANDADAQALVWRRVIVSGRFLHDKELYLAARSLRGYLGYHILTPLERDDGRVVLVNRGWVGTPKKKPSTRAMGNPGGTVRVTGIATVGAKAGWFTPDNDAANNTWFWVDLPQIEKFLGVRLLPIVVEADAMPNPGGFPIGGQTRLALPNDHLQYALTWYALAIVLVVVWYAWHRRRPRQSEASP
jgi:surfeit locus 1 family protein